MGATLRSCLLLRSCRRRLLLRLLFLLLSRAERFISKEANEEETALDKKEAGAEIQEEEEQATRLPHVQQRTICGRCSIEHAQWLTLYYHF
jgi:hypothetical protein